MAWGQPAQMLADHLRSLNDSRIRREDVEEVLSDLAEALPRIDPVGAVEMAVDVRLLAELCRTWLTVQDAPVVDLDPEHIDGFDMNFHDCRRAMHTISGTHPMATSVRLVAISPSP